jgi:hypothetical protein
VLDGAPGAWPKFLAHWMLRSALIMPGLAIAGVRDKRLVTGALLSSTLVSVFLVLFTVAERGRRGMSWKRHRRSRSNGFASQKQYAIRDERWQRRLQGSTARAIRDERRQRRLQGSTARAALVRSHAKKARARRRHSS